MGEAFTAFAKKRRLTSILRTVFLVIFILAILGAGAYFAMEYYFVVNKISVQENTLYEEASIIKTSQIKKKTPLYRIPKAKIEQEIENQYPYLENVKIKFDLPNQVKITFSEEFGELALTLGTELFAVDRELNVLAKETTDSKIPRIILETGNVDECIVGAKLSFIDPDTADIVEEMMIALENAKLLSHIRKIDVRDQFNVVLLYEESFEILLGDKTDLSAKLAMARETIKEIQKEADGSLEEEPGGSIDISDPNQAYYNPSKQIAR